MNLPKKPTKPTDKIFKGGQQPAKNAYANNAVENSGKYAKTFNIFFFLSYIKVCLLSCEYLLKISTVCIGCTRIIERVARKMRQGELRERNTDVRTRWYNARNSSKNG